MDFLRIITEPAILIITAFFLFFIITVVRNYTKTEASLRAVYEFLTGFNKKELSYRFTELNDLGIKTDFCINEPAMTTIKPAIKNLTPANKTTEAVSDEAILKSL